MTLKAFSKSEGIKLPCGTETGGLVRVQGQSGHLVVTLFRNKNNQEVALLSRAAVFQRPNAGLQAEKASSLTQSCLLCMPLTLYDF